MFQAGGDQVIAQQVKEFTGLIILVNPHGDSLGSGVVVTAADFTGRRTAGNMGWNRGRRRLIAGDLSWNGGIGRGGGYRWGASSPETLTTQKRRELVFFRHPPILTLARLRLHSPRIC